MTQQNQMSIQLNMVTLCIYRFAGFVGTELEQTKMVYVHTVER